MLAPIDQSGSVFKEGTLLIFLYPCSPNCIAYFEVLYAYHTLSKFGTVEHSVVTSAGCPGMCVQGWGTQFILGCVYWSVPRCAYWGLLRCLYWRVLCVLVCTKVYCGVLKWTEVLCTEVQ